MNLPLSDAKLLRNGAYVDGNWIESTAHGSYALRNPAPRTSQRILVIKRKWDRA
ncbi:MAG TPA: hypothetical protein VNR70_12210 [Steroidobacteraceae bacterium]|nr:hypothetical protein [Steroidobacteraceae bacterium]